jgi:hypothetical protein
MSNKPKELENALREYITELLKNMKLESKTEEFYHLHKGEDITVTSYWDSTKCDWGPKNDVVRSNINRSLRPTIDKIMEENKDLINFFL